MELKSAYKGKACVIPYVDHVVWKLLEHMWQVNVLDTCTAFKPADVPSGVNLVVGKILDKPPGEMAHSKDGSSLPTPLHRAVSGCSVVYMLFEIDSSFESQLDREEVRAVIEACQEEGVETLKLVPAFSKKTLTEFIADDRTHVGPKFVEERLNKFIGDGHAKASGAFPKGASGT